LAWLATRIGDVRYQLGSLAYLLLAVGHALVIDTPLRHLFVEHTHPAAGVAAPTAVSVAAAVFAERCRHESERAEQSGELRMAGLFVELRASQREWRFASAWLAGIAAVYAASLGLLELPAPFVWNHVAVSGLLALVPLVTLVIGLVRRWRAVQLGAALGLALALVKDIGFDLPQLDAPQRSWTMLAVGAALLLAGFLYPRLTTGVQRLDPLTAAAVGASVPL